MAAAVANGGAGHGARSCDTKDAYIVPVVIGFYHTNRQPEFGNHMNVMPTLKAEGPGAVLVSTAFAVHENQRAEVSLNATQGALGRGGGKPGQGYPAVLTVSRAPSGVAIPIIGDADRADSANLTPTADAAGRIRLRHPGIGIGENGDPMFTIQASKPHAVAFSHQSAMQVRRLTPTECERLQAFPDGYTAVSYRKKPAADGPRYKALGNSTCTTVFAWVGRQIERAQLSAASSHEDLEQARSGSHRT